MRKMREIFLRFVNISLPLEANKIREIFPKIREIFPNSAKLPIGKYSVGIYSWHQNWGTFRCSVLCWTNLWKPKPTEWWSRLGSSHHNILSSGSGAEQCPVLCALLHCYIRPGEHQQRVDCVHCGSHFATHWFPREQTCWTVNTWTTAVSAKTNHFQKYM